MVQYMYSVFVLYDHNNFVTGKMMKKIFLLKTCTKSVIKQCNIMQFFNRCIRFYTIPFRDKTCKQTAKKV